MFADVAASRIHAASAATLAFTGFDQDGEPADPGVVTVQVLDSAGTELVPALTATDTPADDANTRTIALTAVQTAAVDRLTAVWTSSGVTVAETQHDVVGGFYCTISDIRNDVGSTLKDAARFPADVLLQARTEVEYQFEDVTKRAFVPRFRTDIVSGSGRDKVTLSRPDLREVVRLEYWDDSSWTAFDETVADIPRSVIGTVQLRDTAAPCGHNNIRVSYRYGSDRLPADLKDEALKAISYRLTASRSALDARALSTYNAEVGTTQLATPGRGIWVTAIPSVDEALARYTFDRPRVA